MSVVEISSGTLSSTATPNRTLQGPTKAGHAILVLITSYLGSGSTITHNSCQDNQGGSTSDYTLLEAQDTPGGSDNYKHTVFIRENITGASGTTTVTVNASATSNHSMTVLHLDRVPASGVVLDSAAATGSSTAPSVTLAATSVAKALIVGSVTHNNGNPNITANATNQPILYAVWEDNGSTEANAVSGRRVDVTGTYTANWSLSASSTWSAIAVSIAQEGGPAEVGWEGHGVGAQTATSGAALAPTLPAGLLENDILILWAARSDNTAGTTPTNWTNIAALTGNTTAAHRVEAYWRRVPSGGVTAPTFTFGTGTVVRGARITAYSGCITSGDPWDTGTGAPTKTNDTGTDATIEFTDLTTTTLGCLVLALWAYEDDPSTSSVISNYLQPTASHQATALGTDMAIGYQFRQMGAAGAAGLNTITVSGGTFSGPKVGAGLALIPAVSGTTFPVAIGGTLGLAGAIVRQDNKVLAGTLGSAGALVKQGRRALAATVGMAGAIAKRNNKPLAATLGMAGVEADAKLTLLALAGTLGAAGALAKQGRRALSATLGLVGTLAKQNRRALAATLGMAGALAKQNRREFSGTLGAAGALTTTKLKLLALAGTLGSAGALVKQNRRAFAGTLGSAGALLKQGRRALAGTLGLSGDTSAAVPGGLPFRDDFTGAISGDWDENDSNGVVSVLNNRAFFEYDGAQDDWLDPSLVSPAANRADMAGLIALVRLTNRMDGAKGFKLSLSPSAADPDAANSGQINVLYPDLFVPDMDESASLERQRSKDLLLAVVPRAGGGWFTLVSEGKAGGEWPVFPEARIIGASWTENPATVYAHLAARRGRVHIDYAAILASASLPAALTTRLGAALVSESSGTRAAGTSSITNAGTAPRIIEAILTRGANNDTRAVICFRGSSTAYANCWKFKGEFDRVSLHNTGGVVTQTGAKTLTAGTPYHLRVVDHGDLIECYVDGVRWLDWNSTTGAGNTYAGTACDLGASLSVTVTDFAAWDTVTLTSDFGPFPKVPDAVGSAIVTETFTDTNGTSLPTHDADWAIAGGMGTFDIQSNKARITTAGTNGIATRNAVTVNHAARATINLPADVSTYPVDAYPAVVARFTDANNFIQARLLWQDGPSPEIEVWEYVAGAGELIAYVNLTGTVVSAGDYTVTLAAQNAEVTAYLNGEVVAQGTTTVLTGTRAGIGVFDNNPAGQPTWDDFSIFQTNVSLSLSGTLAAAGALVKQSSKAFAGTLSAAGTLRKQSAKAFAGTLGMAGALAAAKLKLVSLAGTLGLSGALVKRGYKVLAGTLGAAGALVKQNRRSFAGTLGAVGALIKRTSRAAAGVLGATGDTTVGSGANLFPVAVAGTLGATGTIRRQIGKTLAGTLNAAGTLVKRINRGLAGILAALGALVKEPRRRVGGAVGMTGAVATTKTRTVALTGTLGSAGTLTTTITRGPEVGGALGFGGGDVAVVLIFTPPPPPVEFGLPAETGIGQAVLVGETPYVEFAPFGPLTVTEAGLIVAAVPPETGGAPESAAPEFRLRG